MRTSKALLVCLSPAYSASDNCRWERDEYAKRQARLTARGGAGQDDDGTIATVFFVATDDVAAEDIRAWRDRALRIDGIALQPWFDEAPQALLREEVADRIRGLGTDIWARVERFNQAETAIGNLLQSNPYFVGRTPELGALHTALRSTDAIGVVTAVHGLGGLRKTELTVQYAHAFRDVYRAGVWQLRAEGHDQILPLLATLADDPAFAFTGSQEAKTDPQLRGREVLAELRRRIRTTDARCLLILDNVTEPGLLADAQTAMLPASTDLSVAATTRLGEEDFGDQPRLDFIEVSGLEPEDGLTLIRDHQPKRDDGLPDFATSADEDAAKAIVDLLDGFTLAIEQIAIYLGRNPDVSPAWLLDGLRADLKLTDQTLTQRRRGHPPPAGHSCRSAEHHAGRPRRTGPNYAAPSLPAPPDTVPWPWLRDMVGRLRPEVVTPSALKPSGDWPRMRRTLEGRRLLTTSGPDLARLHRLHAAHLADEVIDADQATVEGQLIERAVGINNGEDVPIWEFGALLDALIEWVPDNPALASAVNLDNEDQSFLLRSQEYVGDNRPAHLASIILSACQSLVDDRPGHLSAQRGLWVSVSNVAWALGESDADAALALDRQALGIAQLLADAQPGNLTAQRDLSVMLGNIARMLEGTDPDTALNLHRQALGIAQSLADTQPDNLATQRDLSRALGTSHASWTRGSGPPRRSTRVAQPARPDGRTPLAWRPNLTSRESLTTHAPIASLS